MFRKFLCQCTIHRPNHVGLVGYNHWRKLVKDIGANKNYWGSQKVVITDESMGVLN